MVKVGFLFGAGAEICYGLPTGGKFALDIFRQDIAPSKNEFIKMRDSLMVLLHMLENGYQMIIKQEV